MSDWIEHADCIHALLSEMLFNLFKKDAHACLLVEYSKTLWG